MSQTLATRLYGTDEPVEPPRILKAGRLSAELEAGNLRYIRINGVEVLRAISYIVRDRDWGTYAPAISNLKIEETGDRFAVAYEADINAGAEHFAYSARIEGAADGTLTYRAEGGAITDFTTNRTGFVVLHQADLAGIPVTITHTDGREVASAFPRLIDPVQPMMDLRALTHTTADGLTVACVMEGDTFEMEDQRNWTDASYKTYVRPLALPWPYVLEAGSTIFQRVALTVTGDAPSADDAGAIPVSLGDPAGAMPAIGQGLDPDDATNALAYAQAAGDLGPQHLILHLDPRRGHGRETLERQLKVARALGAEPWLEAVIAEVNGYEAEVAALGALARDLGSPFATVLVSPASDLKSTLPGSVWPPAPPADDLYAAARAAFPDVRIGGGMFSYFTELNRKRPPTERLDLVSFTTSPLVHAGDDRSVMESLGALPAIIDSVEVIRGAKPYAVGPSAIGMRMNPYGAAPKDNPDNVRQAMNFADPRQRGLFGAAWALGYAAAFAAGGAEAIALGAPTGAFGVIGDDGLLYPGYHVLRGLARLAGAPALGVVSARPDRIAALAASVDGGTELWLANLTSAPQAADPGAGPWSVAMLDADRVPDAAADPGLMDRLAPLSEGALTLPPYAVARLLRAP